MTTTIVDASVLTDALLKSGERKANARSAIERAMTAQLPGYAIKEFKDGPLRNFVLVHNKLAGVGAISRLVAWARSLHMARHRQATVLEAIELAFESMEGTTRTGLASADQTETTVGEWVIDALRLDLKARIFRAWRDRDRLGLQRVGPLRCYPGEKSAIRSEGHQIDLGACTCDHAMECAMGALMMKRVRAVTTLRDVSRAAEGAEAKRRAKALDALLGQRDARLTEHQCRSLGDAVYAILCPKGGAVLTTNVKDHAPLAEALGRKVVTPTAKPPKP